MPEVAIPPRSLRRRFTCQEISEIVSRYQAGDSIPALCRDFGLSKGGVLQLLRDEGVEMRKQAITPEDAKQAARFYEDGLSVAEIVEQIGYSYSTVRKCLHASGVAMRPKGVKRKST